MKFFPAGSLCNQPKPAAPVENFHLYLSYACPVSQYVLICATYFNIPNLTYTIVHPRQARTRPGSDDHIGWFLDKDGSFPGCSAPHPFHTDLDTIRDIYDRHCVASSDYSIPLLCGGPTSAPSLLSSGADEIVSLLGAFRREYPLPILENYPADASASDAGSAVGGITAALSAIPTLSDQAGYESAVADLARAMHSVGGLLKKLRFLGGSVPSRADIALFVLFCRWECVYTPRYGAIPWNPAAISSTIREWFRDMYQYGTAFSFRLDHIMVHYFSSPAAPRLSAGLVPVALPVQYDWLQAKSDTRVAMGGARYAPNAVVGDEADLPCFPVAITQQEKVAKLRLEELVRHLEERNETLSKDLANAQQEISLLQRLADSDTNDVNTLDKKVDDQAERILSLESALEATSDELAAAMLSVDTLKVQNDEMRVQLADVPNRELSVKELANELKYSVVAAQEDSERFAAEKARWQAEEVMLIAEVNRLQKDIAAVPSTRDLTPLLCAKEEEIISLKQSSAILKDRIEELEKETFSARWLRQSTRKDNDTSVYGARVPPSAPRTLQRGDTLPATPLALAALLGRQYSRRPKELLSKVQRIRDSGTDVMLD